VAGCLEGECHFMEGNIKTKKKVAAVHKILTDAGLEPDRVRMYNLSSAMGPRFAEIAQEMTAAIKELGPSALAGTAC
jgi:coenzyme F420-reducing hydrogenase delta subunit